MALITKDRGSYTQEKEFDETRFYNFIQEIYEDTTKKDKIDEKSVQEIFDKVKRDVESRKSVEADRLFDYIIRESNDKISAKTPEFSDFSASVYRRYLYKQAGKSRGFNYHHGYGDYYTLVKKLVEEGKYTDELLEVYTEEELKELGELIDVSKDRLFSYSGLQMLKSVYLVQTSDDKVAELPQERFLTSAIYMMKDEPKEKRYDYIKDAYWSLSNHYVGLATPTLKNAGTPHGSLSSCHIVTVDDDLKSIFNANTQIARFSSQGSGLGVFLGFLRSRGSKIRDVKGASTGITHPARLLSVLAEYVDQTGK